MNTAQAWVIRGVRRDYDWGMHNGLATWTGISSDGPEAELWFGAHPSAPSPLVGASNEPANLDQLLAAEQVPLLTKFLAAASPLSIQVHPEAALAAVMHASDAGDGLLPDAAEKVEMLIALERFVVMVGWREPKQAAALLAAVGAAPETVDRIAHGDVKSAIADLLGPRPVRAGADQWIRACEEVGLGPLAVEVMTAATAKFGEDPGIPVAALLKAEELQKGDAVYLPAGVPHAYVHGRGVEVMTSSDNVLRLGLTSKQVAVDAALTALRLDQNETIVRSPEDGRYAVPGAPFNVKFFTDTSHTAISGRFRLALPVSGGISVKIGPDQTGRLAAEPGQAIVIPASSPDAVLDFAGHGVVVSDVS
ncbi:mannose-6-phosphate isomerase, class I [Candidatus Nanopelagicales bacterium]|nr:mannose-6-phosphate isomerase, class I [Candidatus Nanopelagicales bacterium]